MRILKSHPLLKMVNSYVIDSPQPPNISYLWNFGSLLAFCLIIQIVTGVTLAMHYNPSVLEAFNSVEHIMRDVNNGWLIRYLHSNTASAFFFLVYLHIGRGLYYGSPQPSNISYRWNSGSCGSWDLWNFGSLLAFCLIIQIVTLYLIGLSDYISWAMHYNPSIPLAFNIVEHIMRDVNNGWFPLLVLIEFISYLAWNVSLALSLAANILSGNILLNILCAYTFIPFLELQIKRFLGRRFIIINPDFISLYCSLILLTYNMFKSTYDGNIFLFSITIFFALSLYGFIYINYINTTLNQKHLLYIIVNIILLIIILICLCVLTDVFLKDMGKLLMNLAYILNPKSPSPPPSSGGPAGPNMPRSDGSSSNQPPKSSNKGKKKRSPTPDTSSKETFKEDISKSELLEFLKGAKKRKLEERIAMGSNSTIVTLGDLGLLSRDVKNPCVRYLNTMFLSDKTALMNKVGIPYVFNEARVDKILQELEK